ncbi:MAG: ATP-binding protein [Acidimicrobiales bacterium]
MAGTWGRSGRQRASQRRAVSLLDRLLHHAVVVVTDGESFRMREARQRGGDPRPRSPDRP